MRPRWQCGRCRTRRCCWLCRWGRHTTDCTTRRRRHVEDMFDHVPPVKTYRDGGRIQILRDEEGHPVHGEPRHPLGPHGTCLFGCNVRLIDSAGIDLGTDG